MEYWWPRKKSGIRFYCHSGESRNPVFSIGSGLRRSPEWRAFGLFTKPSILGIKTENILILIYYNLLHLSEKRSYPAKPIIPIFQYSNTPWETFTAKPVISDPRHAGGPSFCCWTISLVKKMTFEKDAILRRRLQRIKSSLRAAQWQCCRAARYGYRILLPVRVYSPCKGKIFPIQCPFK